MQKKVPLLVVGDDAFAVEETLRLATHTDHYNARHSKDLRIAVELFDSLKPRLLVLAFSNNEAALHFYWRLLTHSKKIQSFAHQCVIMCDGKHAEESCRACFSGWFDEYVVLKPLFDTHRLSLSLRILEKYLPHIDVGPFLYLRAESITKELGGLEELMDPEEQLKFQSSGKPVGNELLQHLLNAHAASGQPSKEEDAEWDLSVPVQSQDVSYESQFKEENQDQSIKILLVEDEAVNQKMIQMVLEREGFQVILACDGLEALAAVEVDLPDLILMDIRMPKLNGLEVTRQLKLNSQWADIPIIMLSAHSEQPVVRECLRSGAVDYIIKPAERKELLDRIRPYTDKNSDRLYKAG